MNRPALVVFGWAAVNGLLTVVLVIYSYPDPFPLIVYMCAVLLVGTYGSVVLLAARRRDADADPGGVSWQRTAIRSTSAGFLAVAVALIGLGAVYGLWLMLVALYPLLTAAVLARNERLSAAVLPRGWRPGADVVAGRTPPRIVPTELPPGPATPVPRGLPRDGPPRQSVAAAAAGAAVARRALGAALRRWTDKDGNR